MLVMTDMASVQNYSRLSVVSLEKTFSIAWWHKKTILNFSHIYKTKKNISIKLKKYETESNMPASPKADSNNCLSYV